MEEKLIKNSNITAEGIVDFLKTYRVGGSSQSWVYDNYDGWKTVKVEEHDEFEAAEKMISLIKKRLLKILQKDAGFSKEDAEKIVDLVLKGI